MYNRGKVEGTLDRDEGCLFQLSRNGGLEGREEGTNEDICAPRMTFVKCQLHESNLLPVCANQ